MANNPPKPSGKSLLETIAQLPSQKKRLLLTGATGFIGRELCNQLELEMKSSSFPYYSVDALCRSIPKSNPLPKFINIVQGDLTDGESLKINLIRRYDTVVHLGAAMVFYPESKRVIEDVSYFLL